MPKFNVTVPHTLSKEEALERLKRFSDLIGNRYAGQVKDISQSWDGDKLNFGFTTFGFKIGGVVESTDSGVSVAGDLPMMAAPFKGKVESSIQEELAKLLRA
ncbi:Putative polyhydroxyalkanoic acid system protein (PHA_gran_rgn) [Pirellulimonas nuda]|uniref:Polyhydroxyalkanoic acid system protein (PHA_gran_rgn) n=1 Tax=Pirellulimonas nuda TaxID=2528009 RepID=A0A518D852_9BACT|nr:polyhydroxyalkanoic acid system family protein [Pirellulimonas nuda]QDU87657.1 Putative polyhydroxyalkanoic acid system protein (PHA_gran_rgn) [Pirellulimonas nuda]